MSELKTGSMRRWAETVVRIRATRKTSEKSAIVADYLRSLEDADLATAAVFRSLIELTYSP